MLSGISTIYFSTELTYPPLPHFAIKKEKVRDLYNKLAEPGGYAYENLELQATIPTLSTRRDEGFSRCQVGSGRIRIEEDNPGAAAMGIDDFVAAVKTVLKSLGPEAGPFLSQRCVIHCTAQPNQQGNSLELLTGKVANVLDAVAPFGRPPSFFGVRFRFAPMEIAGKSEDGGEPLDGETPPDAERAAAETSGEPTKKRKRRKKDPEPVVHRGFITLRFETYSKDIRKVWMEVDAQYAEEVIQDPDTIEKNIRDAYAFVTDNAKRFLDQFDLKDEAEGEDKGAERGE